MTITITREKLLPELTFLRTVVDKKSSVPNIQNVLLETGDGKLLLTTTNLDTCLRSVIDLEAATTDDGFAVSAHRLTDIIRYAPDKAEVYLKPDSNGWLQVKYGGAEFRLATLARENFPQFKWRAGQEVKLQIEILKRMARGVIPSLGKEGGRYNYGATLLILRPGDLILASTDGHSLTVIHRDHWETGLKLDDGERRVLLPKSVLKEVSSLIDPEVKCWVGSEWICFESGSRTVLSRVSSGTFPEYENVLPEEASRPHRAIINRKDLGAALERVRVTTRKEKDVRFDFLSGTLKLSAKDEGDEASEEQVEITYDGPEMALGLNASYLLDFLSYLVRDVEGEDVTLALKNAEESILITPVGEAEDYLSRYVIMPMAI